MQIVLHRPSRLLLLTFAFVAMHAIAAPVRIVATDFGFETPVKVGAGLRHIRFENRGTQIHEAMFVRLPPGMSASDYVAQIKAGALFPKGALDYSGPGLTSPGEATELWLPLDAGNYVLICWHHPRVSVHELTVTAKGDPEDAPPREDATLSLVDYQFRLSAPLRKGQRVIRVETPGPSMHEADIFRLLPGRSADDVRRWYKHDDLEGPAPAVALGGILDSHKLSNVIWIRKNFLPGRYVLHCAMPMSMDAQSGHEYAVHADAGMVTTFDVAE